MEILDFKATMKDKRVDVLGIGISNTPLIKYLVSLGARVTARDKKARGKLGDTAAELESLGVTLRLGDGYLDNLDGDVIYKTPGMRFDVPELVAARERGARVTSEVETFFELCPAPIIGVTGSDGKTTTTTLIYKMLTEQGYTVHLGGNIGDPLLYRVERVRPEDYVVLELSSFQLHTMRQSPHIAVVTNLSPNHLDMHKSYEEYIDAKKNIFKYQQPGDKLVTNADNEVTRGFLGEQPGECVLFSRKEQADICMRDGVICVDGAPVLRTGDIKIPGMHNVENYMAAIGAVYGLVDTGVFTRVAQSFGGVEHRIELVRTLDGVRYYNSSIDSSPNRTANTLGVFEKPVILIAGGKDKGIPYDSMGKLIADKVKTLILIGATADKIEAALRDETARTGRGGDITVHRAHTYPEAVSLARDAAQDGDVVVLSPASTSFDMFDNFEQRGNLFKELVNQL